LILCVHHNKISFQSQADHPRTPLCSCDLDLDPMTLKYEYYLTILQMYLHTENELSQSRFAKLRAVQHSRVVVTTDKLYLAEADCSDGRNSTGWR